MKIKSLSFIALLAALCAGSVIGQAYASEATSLKIGSVVTLRSVNFPNMFLRHRNWVVDLTTVSSELDQKDSTFRIVKGLAGQGVSLEADNYPGYFLRHQDYRLKLAKYENTTLYKRDATFLPRQGLADTNGVSFESENFPGRFLRHRGYNFWLDPKGNDDLFKKDATFMPVAGLAGAPLADLTPPPGSVNGAEKTTVPGSERDFIENVGDRIHFTVDSSRLTAEAQDTLRRQAAWMKQYPQVTITVEGHANERGTREYNIALSARRSDASRQFLIAQGVEPSRLATIPYGKERPVAVCNAESCWSQNRRVVSVVTGGGVSGYF